MGAPLEARDMNTIVSPTVRRVAGFGAITAVWVAMTLVLLPLGTVGSWLAPSKFTTDTSYQWSAAESMYSLMAGGLGVALFGVSICALPWVLMSRDPGTKLYVAVLPFLWVLHHWVYSVNSHWPSRLRFLMDETTTVTLGWVGIAAAISSPFVVSACWQLLDPQQRAERKSRYEARVQRRIRAVDEARRRRGSAGQQAAGE